jgi:H+-transporting ATPase
MQKEKTKLKPEAVEMAVKTGGTKGNKPSNDTKYGTLPTNEDDNGSHHKMKNDSNGKKDGHKDDGPPSDFQYSSGLTTEEAHRLLEIHGKNELPETVIPKWYIFVSQLWQPMPVMIWIAALVELLIANYVDMDILLFIQFANASIGYYETTKAGDAVAALKSQLQPRATAKRDGVWSTVNGSEIVPGDLVLLAAGAAVPADCRVNEGRIEVDQAALTGESLPVTMYKGSSVKMGSTVSRGEQSGTVEFTGANTFFGKTASLLKQDNEISNLQRTLVGIIIVLVCVSTILCAVVFFYVYQLVPFHEALSFTVVLMVASIPMAIEVVTTTTLALGSKELAHDGAIVTRLAAIEDLAGMAILCSDKTGTLTQNKMEIQLDTPIYKDGESQYSILRYAAMATKWHEPARDALDTLTLTAVDLESLDTVEQLDYMPFDPIVKRTEGTVKDSETGKVYKTSKGAPHVMLQLLSPSERSAKLTKQCEKDVKGFGKRGIRCLAVSKTNDDGEWELLGLLTFLDPPRIDTKFTIEQAHHYGVAVKMITGDHLLIALETARQLDLGDYIKDATDLPMLHPETKEKPEDLSVKYGDICLAASGFAQVFPEHKYLIVECLRELGFKVGMTGDGVNDAPALKRADVGVAVLGCTDAARAAADIVLTQEGLSTIVKGIIVARKIFVRIRNFIVYRIAATLQLLVFFFVAVLVFRPQDYMPAGWKKMDGFPDSTEWPLFFHMPVLMLMLITLLNDGTLIAIGYDNAIPSQEPEVWNMRALFTVASVLAGIALLSSLLLLWLLLDSWTPGSVFQRLGLGGISYGQVTTAIYLKVSISDFLTLLSARTGHDWFWQSMPAPILGAAAIVALSTSTFCAVIWPASYPDKVFTLGLGKRQPYSLVHLIWLYCICWWLVQDAAKVATYRLMEKYNMFGFNNTGKLVLPESTAKYIRDNKEKDMSAALGGPHGGDDDHVHLRTPKPLTEDHRFDAQGRRRRSMSVEEAPKWAQQRSINMSTRF